MSEKYLMSNGLRLCYEEFGATEDPAIVLIMGLGTQMISWPTAFCELLAEKGYRVIRFDNRDIGLSEKIQTKTKTNLLKLFMRQRLGLRVSAPYTLRDMALDTIGLLDALGISKAHWVGASMGGMIGQILAAEHSERTLSLTSIMSTTGRKGLPQAPISVIKQMLSRPSASDEKNYIKHSMKTWALIGSPDYPPDAEELKSRIMTSMQRSSYPAGYRNQVAAIMESGDRRGLLHRIKSPTLVIHGKADVLVPVDGGIETARNIKGAKLEVIEGMGHDLPKQLLPRIANLINDLIEKNLPSEGSIVKNKSKKNKAA